MTLRRVVSALLLIAIIGLAAAYLSRFVFRLQFNRALYALHQGSFPEAERRFSALVKSQPGNAAAQVRLGEALLRQAKWQAAHVALKQPALSGAQRDYWLAIACYEIGKDDEARRLLGALAESQSTKTLSAVEQQLAALGEAALAPSQDPNVMGEVPQPESRMHLESMLWHSWSGRLAMRRGMWEDAAGMLQEAIDRHDKNPRSRLLGAASAALSGNYPQSQYYVDTQSSPAKFLLDVQREVMRAAEDQLTSTVTVLDLPRQTRVVNSRQRASLWLEVQKLRFEPDTGLTTPAYSSTDDPVLRMLQGDLLSSKQRLSDAYAEYLTAASLSSNLQLQLRAYDIAGEQAMVRTYPEEFVQSLYGATYIKASETTCTVPLSAEGIALFRQYGELAAAFSVSAPAEFRVTIIAASDMAQNLGPVIRIQIDTFSPGELYVAREGWDCYSVTSRLSPGNHEIKLAYSAEADAVSEKGEDRSLYVLGVLINPVPAGKF
ncbi:MAG: tetratricopeptide repeat protein [Candidatus Sumerlaeaceae bacterium]